MEKRTNPIEVRK